MSDTLMPTFRSEDLSLMQSALAEVLARRGEAERSRGRRRDLGDEAAADAAPAPTTPEEVADDPRMLTFAGVAARWADEEDLPAETRELRELTGGEPDEGTRELPEPAEADRAVREGVEAAVARRLDVAAARGVTDCVELFMRVARAEESGDPEQIDHWRNVVRFSSCDANFIDECVEAYLGFKLSARRVPYRRHRTLDDFVIDVPDRVRIGVVGDWGTGMEPARVVLQALAGQRPDIVLHVGDIYYSGTRNEVNKRFLPIVEDVFPDALSARKPRLFTLSGNHDMYSGGRGYYALLDQIGQPASYFCLRNRRWQVLGMDTGLHDRNPLPPHKLTKLDDGEAEWHRDKVRRAGGRRTVLMSHHQLFTFEKPLSQDAQGRPSGLNVNLYGQLREVL
ncbi:MAG TPA: metallophosphoesterase, partial [Longimicrobium sp.]